MYLRCEHERKNIVDVIRYQKHIQDVNRMNDKGEIPPLSNGQCEGGCNNT